jgi:predicted small lipoprotein YifL
MKRLAWLFGALALVFQLTGCGGSSPASGTPADDSNLPSEVREYESRRSAERAAKKLPPRPPKSATRREAK